MSPRWQFTGVGVTAMLVGAALWLAMRPPDTRPTAAPVEIAPAAFYAASFTDATGRSQALGQFQGRVLVVNFWATWCAPCREEMPGFVRLQSRWAARGVQFVGLANEERGKVDRFGREIGVNYPLWTGGDEVSELSRRLGNRGGVLPHTAILGPRGEVLEVKVGPYSESQMENRLAVFTANLAQNR